MRMLKKYDLKERDKIIIYGAGKTGSLFYRLVANYANVISFVDSNPDLVGKKLFGIEIISNTDLGMINKNLTIVVCSLNYEDEIIGFLVQIGCKRVISAGEYYLEMKFKKHTYVKHRLILMNTHEGANVGDHLISIAEQYFITKRFEDYELIEVSAGMVFKSLILLKEYIHPNDILLISGGGYLGSLWKSYGEDNVRLIINCFPNNRIVILPQTIYFEASKEATLEKRKTAEIYNSHNNLHIYARDVKSLDLCKEIFDTKVGKSICPDMGLLLDMSYMIGDRKGIVLCLRDDKEKVLVDEDIERIKCIAKDCSEYVSAISMIGDELRLLETRVDLVNEKVEEIRKSKLVITDRLHCMILCAITGTNCIFFDNLTEKVSGTFNWIRYLDYIQMANSVEDVEYLSKQLIRSEKINLYNNTGLLPIYDDMANSIIGG